MTTKYYTTTTEFNCGIDLRIASGVRQNSSK